MKITLGPIVATKELILNKISQEQLMEHYLGIPVKKGLFKSPLRQDNKVTCSFYRGTSGTIYFKDFSGDFVGDVFAVVMRKYSCTFQEAVRIIGNDFGLVQNDFLVKHDPKLQYTGSKLEERTETIIQVEIRQFQQYELD